MPIILNLKQWKRLAVGWLFFCTVLFCLPGNALPESRFVNFPYFDKFVHVGLFFVLTFLMLRAFAPQSSKAITTWFLAIAGYGALIEVIQLYLIPFRSFDLVDILADTLGIALGFGVVYSIKKFS